MSGTLLACSGTSIQFDHRIRVNDEGPDMPRSKTWWYTRITMLVLGLIVIYVGVPILYSLAGGDTSDALGLIQIGLMVLLFVGFVAYLGANYTGSGDR